MRLASLRQPVAALALGALMTTAVASGPREAFAAGGHRRISDDLRTLWLTADAAQMVTVIVQTDAGSSSLAGERVQRRGHTVSKNLELIDGVVATMPISEAIALAEDPLVSRITPDRQVRLVTKPGGAPAAGFASLPLRPDGIPFTGRGVGVAIIDSGIYPHEDLAADAIRTVVDFVNPGGRDADGAADPLGHGTHIAGIVAGQPVVSSDSGLTLGGVAPGSHLVSLRVLDHRGLGDSSDVIAALDWCVRHADEYGLRVVNLSLGQMVVEPAADDPLAQAAERAWRSGLVVVAAAGNMGGLGTGYGTINSPGNDPLVLTVGALDTRGTPSPSDDDVAPFSSRGPTRFEMTLKPDLLAAGTHVISLRSPHSLLDREMPQARVSTTESSAAGVGGFGRVTPLVESYFDMSGSSMAAAVVSGAAALLLEAEPEMTPDDVKARLMKHARHDLPADIYTRGAGSLDLAAALAGIERADASASPRVSADELSPGGVSLTDTGQSWGDASAWSLDEVYGDASQWGESAAISHEFFEDPCITGQGLVWQSGLSWQTRGRWDQGMTWQSGMIWQSGLVWQSGMVWQTGLVWQSGMVWQSGDASGVCPF